MEKKPKTEFLYLSEPDMIAAGVLDAHECVNVCEEVFSLLNAGDYLMGGPNHNSHGLGIVFPKETKFPNMPVSGPDRRFVAMPGYLGGRFDVCGVKWYGSNQANIQKGLPRSVLTVLLNNKDTGEPLCLMSANLVSSARTGAVPGVAARYLVRKGSKTLAVLGCGPINKACVKAILTQIDTIEHVVCYDLFEKAAQSVADFAVAHGKTATVEPDLEKAVRDADVVTIAASRIKPLVFKDEWLKEGCTVLTSGPIHPDENFWLKNKIVYDNIGLHEAYVEEAVASGDKDEYYSGVIGGPIYRLIDSGRLPALQDSIDLGGIINSGTGGRTNDTEKITFVACGMSVFDLGWAYQLYQNALSKNIGTQLALWDEPYVE